MKVKVGRAMALGLSGVMLVAGVVAANTSLEQGDAAIVGDASTSANAVNLECGGSAVNIQLDVTANNGNITSAQILDGHGEVQAPTSLTVTSSGTPPTGIMMASGTQTKSFTAGPYSGSGSPQTLSFTIALSAAADALPGVQSYAITFSETGAGMVNLAQRVDLGVGFSSPLVHVDVTCAAGYTFDGFYQPVGGNSHDDASFNISAKAGQGIALKWNLYDSNEDVVTDASKYTARSLPLACSLAGTPEATVAADDAGSSGFRYDPVGLQTTFAWKTNKAWANTCRTLELSYDGNVVAELNVRFTK